MATGWYNNECPLGSDRMNDTKPSDNLREILRSSAIICVVGMRNNLESIKRDLPEYAEKIDKAVAALDDLGASLL